MSDTTRIIDYMTKKGSITGYEAVLELGCLDYRKRISEIARSGHNIRKVWRTHTNEAGKRSRFLEYSLEVQA